MTIFRRFALIAAAAAALSAAPGLAVAQQGASGFSATAFVNDQVITAYDVAQRERLLTLAGVPSGREAALDSMIEDRLKRHAAEEAGLSVSRADVETGLSRFAASLGADAETLPPRLKAAGVSRVTLRDYVEAELLWSQYVQRNFMARAQVSDIQLDDALANSDRLSRKAFDLSEISIPYGNDREGAIAQARRASQQINAGADVASIARRLSRSATAQKGGRVGLVPAASVPPQLRAALEGLSPGQATQPMPIPRGVAVLVLHDVRVERIEPTPEVREQVRAQMLEERLTRLAQGRLDELKAAAFIERSR